MAETCQAYAGGGCSWVTVCRSASSATALIADRRSAKMPSWTRLPSGPLAVVLDFAITPLAEVHAHGGRVHAPSPGWAAAALAGFIRALAQSRTRLGANAGSFPQ